MEWPQPTLACTLKWPILLCSLPLFILGFLLPIYAQELGASASNIGGLFAVFSLMMILVRPLVGLAIDRYGRKAFLLMGLGAYILAMGVFSLADSMAMLYIARFIQGFGAALTWIATYTIAAELAVAERRGEALGEVDGAGDRGAVYGAIIAFALLTWLPLRLGWMVVFMGYTGCAIIGVWLAWRHVPETKDTIPAAAPAPAVSQPLPGSPGQTRLPFNLGQLATIPQGLGALLSIVFLTKASQALVKLLLLIFLRDRFALELWQLAAAYLPAALILGFLPARMGRLSDRMGRAPLIVSGLIISAVTSCFMPGLPSLAWYIAVFALNAVGVVTAMPAQKALVGDLTRREHWGRAFGFYTFTASVGTAIGPLLGGLLYDRVGHSVPFYANAVLLVVSAVWALIALRRSQLHSRSLFSMARVGTAWLFQMIWTSLRRVETICLKIRPS
jgi:MFS family permease